MDEDKAGQWTPNRKRGRPKGKKGGASIRKKEGGRDLEEGDNELERPEGSPPLSSPIIDTPPGTRLPWHLHGVPAMVLEKREPGESLESWMTRNEAVVAEWATKAIQDENLPDQLRAMAFKGIMDLMIAGRKGKLAAAGKVVGKVVGERESALVGAARAVQRMSDGELSRLIGGV